MNKAMAYEHSAYALCCFPSIVLTVIDELK